MLINCDIGERGIGHPLDMKLLDYIHIANIACGGHSGDAESALFYRDQAERRGIAVYAHLSYPDRKNFGRVSPDISDTGLMDSLGHQLDLIPGVKCVKLHGALYNDTVSDPVLAGRIAQWMNGRGIINVITLPGSELGSACIRQGINVYNESYAERGYGYSSESGRLHLLNRGEEGAVITDPGDALEQSKNIIFNRKVYAVIDGSGAPEWRWFPVESDTICIHSDSSIAIELADGIFRLTGGRSLS